MQRRDFVRSALFGTGAAFSLALPPALAALDSKRRSPLSASLAKLEVRGEVARWQPIEQCRSSACGGVRSVRVEITALGFPQHFEALSIEAMFATNDGLRPFRMAHYQPGAVSPVSKPFSFETESTTLAGFRVEHGMPESGQTEIAGTALLGAGRLALASGHYLLVVNNGSGTLDLGNFEAPSEASPPPPGSAGRDASFAWLQFSVRPLDA